MRSKADETLVIVETLTHFNFQQHANAMRVSLFKIETRYQCERSRFRIWFLSSGLVVTLEELAFDKANLI